MMKKKELIISTFILIFVVSLTYYIIFKNNSFSSMYKSISQINIIYIIIILFLMITYFILQGIFNKVMLETLNIKINLKKGAFYALVEFFFSAITPSSSGGEPVVMFYMLKDKISLKISSLVMLTSTIVFKLYLILGAILILVCKNSLIYECNNIEKTIFFLGLIIDIIVIIINLLLMYNKKIIKKILQFFYKIKNNITKNNIDINKKSNELILQYNENAKYIKNHKKKLLKCIVITFIQRTIFFSISYVIYRGFGFNKIPYFDFLLLQIFIQISLECIFIPGAAGISELLTNSLFVNYFGSLSTSAMLLFRTMTFHLPLIIISILILIATKLKYKIFESK